MKMIPNAPKGDTIVVDGKGHLMGRLASIVAKQLLSGKKIVVVRGEQIVVSGSIKRNKVKQAQFLKKRHNTNPKKGPIHFKSPARMFWRTLRGTLPHKTVRGQLALAKLAVSICLSGSATRLSLPDTAVVCNCSVGDICLEIFESSTVRVLNYVWSHDLLSSCCRTTLSILSLTCA